MSKIAIVVGATGLIGAELVNQLVRAEHISSVRTVTRRRVKYTSEKVHNKVVDFEQLSDFSHLFEGDFLFSCLGTTLKQAGSLEAQRRVDLHYQLAAAALASEQGVDHYFLVSSSGANAKSLSPYLKMKGELEQGVANLAFNSISIFQPSLLLGERDVRRTGESLAANVMPLMCKFPGLKKYRPIYGAQVAEKMVQVSQAPRSGLERFVLDEVFP